MCDLDITTTFFAELIVLLFIAQTYIDQIYKGLETAKDVKGFISQSSTKNLRRDQSINLLNTLQSVKSNSQNNF